MADEEIVFKQTYDADGRYTRTQRGRKFLKFVIIVLIALCTPRVVLNVFFIQMNVVGVSMQPTLNAHIENGRDNSYYENSNKDTIYVSRLYRGGVGDIVAIKGATASDKLIVKRYIATEGQTVALKLEDEEKGLYAYYLDGEKLDEPYIADNYLSMDVTYFAYFKKIATNKNESNKEASLVVPEGQMFVLGDNRGVSEDSHKFGCIAQSRLIGKVSFYYTYDKDLLTYAWSLIFG